MSEHRSRSAGCLLGGLLLAAAPAPPQPAERSEADFLSRVRQLTFDGRRAGEGYFSPDGRRMVFQSERESGNPFFQIYLLDLTTGDIERVSPGHGKTTCPFIRPGTGDVLFASTHHDPRSEELQREELELRAGGEARRYTWDYDPEMDLYVREAATGELRRLTEARGYDAEASYSPDGESLVWTSTRHGGEGGQLFIGRWDHREALAALGEAPPRGAGATQGGER